MPLTDSRIRELLQVSDLTLQIRCDIIDVVTGLRPTARLMVRPGFESESCARAIVHAGLSVAVGRGLKWQPKRNQFGVVDWMGEAATSSIEMEKFIVFYIALTQVKADGSRAADEARDDVEFGQALGYPLCCVKFVNERGRVPEHKDVFALYATRGCYEPLCWPGAMALDSSLLIHYPCSVSCAASHRMSEFRWRYIRNSGCESVIALVRSTHELVYWLDNEGLVRAGSQAPGNALAVAKPAYHLD